MTVRSAPADWVGILHLCIRCRLQVLHIDIQSVDRTVTATSFSAKSVARAQPLRLFRSPAAPARLRSRPLPTVAAVGFQSSFAVHHCSASVPGPEFPAPTAAIWVDMAKLVTGGEVSASVTPFCIVAALIGASLSEGALHRVRAALSVQIYALSALVVCSDIGRRKVKARGGHTPQERSITSRLLRWAALGRVRLRSSPRSTQSGFLRLSPWRWACM